MKFQKHEDNFIVFCNVIFGFTSVVTFIDRSRKKMMRHTISMLSVNPHGGSQGGFLYRRSEVMDREEGFSMNAKQRMTVMANPRPLCTQGTEPKSTIM